MVEIASRGNICKEGSILLQTKGNASEVHHRRSSSNERRESCRGPDSSKEGVDENRGKKRCDLSLPVLNLLPHNSGNTRIRSMNVCRGMRVS